MPISPDQVKTVEGRRLVWWSQPPTQEFWFEHWRGRVVPSYFASAGKAIVRTEMGRTLLKVLPRPGRSVEAGCGAGMYVAGLRFHGLDVVGVEWSAELVDLVKSVAPDLPVQHGDVCNLDVPGDSLDGYISIGVIEHRREGPGPFLTEAHRVLRAGGVAVVSTPAFGWLRRIKHRLGSYRVPSTLPFYQYGLTRRELVECIRANGFKIESWQYENFDRLLREESALWRRMSAVRGGYRLTRIIAWLLRRLDGHMVTVVARKL